MPLLLTAGAMAPRGVFGSTLTASLQRTVGNQATARLLGGRPAALREGPAAADSARPGPGHDERAPVVQRKVGLEFETGHPVEEWRKGEKTTRGVAYSERVFEAKLGTWKIVADSSNLEFVTEPVVETDEGRKTLKTIIAEMRQFIDALVARRAADPQFGAESDEEGWTYVSNIAPSLGDTLLGQGGARRLTPLPLSQRDLGANPQATGGVPLDKVADLVEAINTAQLEHLKNKRSERAAPWRRERSWPEFEYGEGGRSLTGMSPLAGELLSEASRQASLYVEAVLEFAAKEPEGRELLEALKGKGLPNLRGLLTLVMSYLIAGDEQQSVWDYSKLIAPLMSRTNFSALFDTLPPEEREFFSPEIILAVLQLDKDAPIFAKGYGTAKNPDRGPKRLAWLESIRDKTIDLMSLGGGSTVTRGHVGSSTSMGAQRTPDTGVSGVPLAVLELRRLPQEQNPDEWERTALLVFDLFKRLSNPEPVKQAEEPSQPESGLAPEPMAPSSEPKAPTSPPSLPVSEVPASSEVSVGSPV